MSFEVIDNAFQVLALLCMTVASFHAALKHLSRSCLILAFGYASFMLGTLYYLLYLTLMGFPPQIFYVAECAWMASYLFFLSLEILYWEQLHPPFSLPALLIGLVVMGLIMKFEIFGPSPLMSGALAIAAGGLTYLCISDLQAEEKPRLYELSILLLIALQITLYIVSMFIHDYTRFNPYYVVDILLTLTMVGLLPHVLHEEAS